MTSLAYTVTVGLFGLMFAGLVYTIYDQVLMGDLWNMAIQWQTSGTMLNLFSWGWVMLPIVITFAFVVGIVATAHQTKNEV